MRRSRCNGPRGSISAVLRIPSDLEQPMSDSSAKSRVAFAKPSSTFDRAAGLFRRAIPCTLIPSSLKRRRQNVHEDTEEASIGQGRLHTFPLLTRIESFLLLVSHVLLDHLSRISRVYGMATRTCLAWERDPAFPRWP